MDFRFVLVRLTLCLIPGIVCAHFLSVPLVFWVVASAVNFFAVFIWNRIRPKGRSFGMAILFGLQAFLCGGWVETSQNQIPQNHYARFITEKPVDATLVLNQRLRTTAIGRRFVADVISLDSKPVLGKVLLYSPEAKDYPIGTQLKVHGKFVFHRTAGNPGQFDYGAYLRRQKIHARFYPEKTEVLPQKSKSIASCADGLRTYLIAGLRDKNFAETELQILNALLLGQQQDIDPSTLRDFQFAGAVHILSVSGLHVGFVAILLQFLLKPIPRNRQGSALRLVLIVASLWAFAIVAGLSPSVVRSATMFSFLACGQHLRRGSNSFHTLVVSLFVLLIVDTSYLFDVGFQLSYAALGSILWLQPHFSKLWKPRNKVVSYFWDIVTVSLAAQLGTLPLSLYYFHQFPGLFLITNIVVIPMVAFIMGFGFAVLLVNALWTIPDWLAKSLELSIALLNRFMRTIADADQMVWQNIPFHILALVASYLLLVVFFSWISRPSFIRLASVMTFVAILQIGWLWWQKNASTEAELIVFQSRSPQICMRENRSLVWQSRAVDSMAMKPYVQMFYKPAIEYRPLPNVASFGRRKILVVDSLGIIPQASTDLLIICEKPKVNPERALAMLKPSVVIVDGSNSAWHQNLWRRACEKQKIPFHSTYEKGSFILREKLFLP